jgi:nitric oxide reductase NorQ protein
MESSLSDLIPPKRFYDRYVQRKLPGGMSDVEMLETAIRTRDRLSGGSMNVLLQGPTGPGKTSLYLAVCAKNEWPLGTANLNGQTTAEDLVGQVIPVVPDPSHLVQLRDAYVKAQTLLATQKLPKLPDDQRVDITTYIGYQEAVFRSKLMYEEAKDHTAELEWVNGLLVRLMLNEEGFEHTVFLADEVNFAPAKIMALLNGVTDDRRQLTLVQHRGELIQAVPGFHFGAAMNPNYEGTRPLNKAFKDRFHIQLYVGYDQKVEAELIKNTGLQKMTQKLRKAHAQGEIETPTSTRTMLQFEQLINVFGAEFAIQSLCDRYDESEQKTVRDSSELLMGAGLGGSTKPMGKAQVD